MKMGTSYTMPPYLQRPFSWLKREWEETSFLTIWVNVMSVIPNMLLFYLITYLTNDKEIPFIKAVMIVNVQEGFTSIFGIIGAIIVDVYLTDYGMIAISSLIYALGLLIFGINGLYLGLVLIIIAKESLSNSSFTLSGELRGSEEKNESIKSNDPEERNEVIIKDVSREIKEVVKGDESTNRKKSKYVLLSISDYTFFFVFLFVHVSFKVAASFMLSVTILSSLFLKIQHFRKSDGKRDTPLKHIPRVYIAYILKRHHPPPNANELYEENPNQKQRLEHTDRHRWLDKAAAIKETQQASDERKKWLCTVTEVEECKQLLHMAPMCITYIAYGMVKSVGNTFFLEHGDQMNSKMGNIEFPLAAFLYIARFSSFITVSLYRKFIPTMLTGHGEKYVPTIAYAMGTVLSTLCCTVASWIAMEISMRSTTGSEETLSIFWLTPLFIIFGAMDGLTREGIQEFFNAELPPSMVRYDQVFTEGIIGVGTLSATLLVLVVEQATNWFSADDESMRLDRFYHLLTVVGTIIFFLNIVLSVRYYRKPEVEEEAQSQVHEGNEQAPPQDVVDQSQVEAAAQSQVHEGNEQAPPYVVDIISQQQQEVVDERVKEQQAPSASSQEIQLLEIRYDQELEQLIQPANNPSKLDNKKLSKKFSKRF